MVNNVSNKYSFRRNAMGGWFMFLYVSLFRIGTYYNQQGYLPPPYLSLGSTCAHYDWWWCAFISLFLLYRNFCCTILFVHFHCSFPEKILSCCLNIFLMGCTEFNRFLENDTHNNVPKIRQQLKKYWFCLLPTEVQKTIEDSFLSYLILPALGTLISDRDFHHWSIRVHYCGSQWNEEQTTYEEVNLNHDFCILYGEWSESCWKIVWCWYELRFRSNEW